jgi:acetate kinase
MPLPESGLRSEARTTGPSAGPGALAVVNAGSSSIKFALYDSGPELQPLYSGRIEGIGVAPRLHVKDAQGAAVMEREWSPSELDSEAATRQVLQAGAELLRGTKIRGVGHRMAHGGVTFSAPVLVDDEVFAELESLVPLAPLHQPHNLAAIHAIAEAAPHIPQVACFDTAFHRSQPQIAELFGLPKKFTAAGVRRYGFHGLSYEYVSDKLAELAPRLAGARVIIAHLGNGASLCALESGRSVATTMAFTPLDGLIMGTRCGSLDPGVLLYLMDVHGMGPREIETLLYRQSGLLGVSGVSSDMRALRASRDPHAAEAIELFVYRIVREIGSLAAALGGLDGLVFTGGIGENDAETRAEIAKGCAWLGLDLDLQLNGEGPGRVSNWTSRIEAWVVPTDEEAVIARHTVRVLESPAGESAWLH